MAKLADPKDLSRFDGFDIHNAAYKTVAGHDIETAVLIPKHVTENGNGNRGRSATSSLPMILRIHGGGLIAFSSLCPVAFQPWILELATRHSAIIVSPDYRLLPEAGSVAAPVSDIFDDLFPWITDGGLSDLVAQKTGGAMKVDTSRILTTGDSAGGWLSLVLALRRPQQIRSVVACYPMADLESFLHETQGSIFGMPPFPRDAYDAHIAGLAKKQQQEGAGGEMVISADPLAERIPIVFAMMQHGLLKNHVDPKRERELFPLSLIQDGARFPRGGLVVTHGKNDSVVPVEGSYKLERLLKEQDPELSFRLVVRDGDHGFDHGAALDDEWLREALADAVKAWL